MLSQLNSLNFKLCSKQCNQTILLHLIVVPQLNSGLQLKYSTKARQAGHANEQSMYFLMSMVTHLFNYFNFDSILTHLKDWNFESA